MSWKKITGAAIALPLLIWSFSRADMIGFKVRSAAPLQVGSVGIDAARIALRAASLRADTPDEQALQTQLLADMVREAALSDFAAALGITVSDARTADMLRASPMFLDPVHKVFDPAALDRYAKRMGLSRRDVSEYVRDDLIQQTLTRALSFNALPSDATGALLRNALYAGREVEIGTIAVDSVLKQLPNPDAAALRAYYDAHKEEFRLPEQRAVTFFEVSPDALRSRITPAEADLRAAYETEKSRLSLPEKRTIRQYLFQSDAQARAFAAKPDAKVPFSVLGTFSAGQVPQAAAAAFHTPLNGFTPPQVTPFGTALYQVSEIKPSVTPSYAELLPQLREQQIADQAARLAGALGDSVQEDAAGGASPNEIATKRGLKVQTLRVAQNTVPENFKAAASAWFSAPQDGETRAIELGSGRTLFYRIDSVTPSSVPDYAAAEPQVRKTLLRQAAKAEVQRRAQSLQIALNTGKPAPADFKTVQLQRFEDAAGIDADLHARIFAAALGSSVVSIPSDAMPNATIVRVKRITPPTKTAPAEAGIGRAWATTFGNEVLSAALVVRNAPLRLNREAFESAAHGGR